MRLMIRIIVILVLAMTTAVYSQFTDRELTQRPTGESGRIANDNYFYKPTNIINYPTASILRGGDLSASLRMFEQGGVLGRLSVGISDRIMFGVSYGGLHIIGREQQIDWNSVPGIHFVYRLIEENLRYPAMVVGFDSQGYGPYFPEKKNDPDYNENYPGRYYFKSRGFYCVVSKGYASLISVGLHAGVSYSLEYSSESKKRAPTLFLATDMHLSRNLGILFEYDFATDDPNKYPRGLLNTGFRWAFSPNMFFEFNFQNILKSGTGESDVRRILRLTYHGNVLQ